MAHKKAAGSSENLKDSQPKYRGVKLFAGQTASAGNIIIRQKGDKYQPGVNVYKGKDFTLHARVDGIVFFRKKKLTKYDGRVYLETFVDILSAEEIAKKAAAKAALKTAAPKVKKAKTPKAPKAKLAKTAKPAAKKTATPKEEKATAPKAEKTVAPKKTAAPKAEKTVAPKKASAPKKKTT